MRSALCSALLCGVAFGAAAQERVVTFEETPPVTVTGFAVGRADYDRLVRTNSFTAGKIGVSLFKPAGDAYLFAQLTTALDGDRKSTRLNSSHSQISYAVFCLKKKKNEKCTNRMFDTRIH